MKEIWTTLASLMGVWAFLQTFLHAIFPPELRFAAVKLLHRFSNYFSTYCYYDITEMDNGVNTNELYNAVQLYLSSNAATLSPTPTRLTLTRPLNSSTITYGISNNDRLTDTFNNVAVQWEHVVTQRSSQTFSWRPVPDEKRGFTLRVGKKNKHLVLDSYLEHIVERANDLKRKSQERLLYTNSRGGSLDSRGHPWESVPFKHPSTFETLAMDPCRKREIMDDLRDFAGGEGFYHRTGRAWKRGYLLYGPPGTGKSSMIAAMANYLGYDIYDLELTEVSTNSELRKLLMKTTSKSIIVIEDIDCSINLTNRNNGLNGGGSSSNGSNRRNGGSGYEIRSPPGGNGGEDGNNGNTITLSGLLNFTDGLWSCCGSERIFVFTTNHVEKLDPALLRSGRMDMHVHMSYCTLPALKILLKNYLGYDEEEDGGLNSEVVMELENVIDDAEMTPADVSEVLIKNRRDGDKAVSELIEALKVKAEKNRTAAKKKRGGEMVEDEEHEKRALDNIEEGQSGGPDESGGGCDAESQQQSSTAACVEESSINDGDGEDQQDKVH